MESTYPRIEEFTAYLEKEGIKALYPHQVEGINVLARGESLLLATPTSSGKTVVSYYGIIRAWKMGLRTFYVVPLRALAEEKYEDMKFFEQMGMKVGISTGDFDSPSNQLRAYDVVISTSEKVDSLLRNNSTVFENLGFMVFDEIHNIGDESRGSTLEIVLSKVRYLMEGVQFASMSATVGNVKEIGDWLDATIVVSDFRPVDLKKFVITAEGRAVKGYSPPVQVWKEDGQPLMAAPSLEELVMETLNDSGQTLIFVRSRKATETTAEKIGKMLSARVPPPAAKNGDGGTIARGNEKLDALLKAGVGFHHAGMLSEERRIVERMFRERKIKIIAATTTLAAGLNLPARSVIIRDVTRYNGFNMEYLPNLEVQQMLGRAGRAKYDKIGYGYIYSQRRDKNEMYASYINGELEDIRSMIDRGKVTMHVLGLIASSTCRTLESLSAFFATTLASREQANLSQWITQSLTFLEMNGMIRNGEKLSATPFGRKVSELYINPVSGVILRDALNHTSIEDVLLEISVAPDMLPFGGSDDMPLIGTPELRAKIPEEKAKVAAVLLDWISEKDNNEIIQRHGIYPADLRSRVELADWLSHSLYEISRVLGANRPELKLLNYRIAEGVMEDVVPLTFIPFVGRVRARLLKINGYAEPKDVANANPADLERIRGFGEGVSEKVVESAKRYVERMETRRV